MRARLSIIGIGIVILAFGTIFYLQGNSVIGPTSSFMYSNPKWVVHGEQIAVGGVVVIAVGIWLSLRRPRS